MTRFGSRMKILHAIQDHIEREGYAPTMAWLTVNGGFKTKSTVFHHLDSLRHDGMIEGVGRSLTLTDQGRSVIGKPPMVIGSLAVIVADAAVAYFTALDALERQGPGGDRVEDTGNRYSDLRAAADEYQRRAKTFELQA